MFEWDCGTEYFMNSEYKLSDPERTISALHISLLLASNNEVSPSTRLEPCSVPLEPPPPSPEVYSGTSYFPPEPVSPHPSNSLPLAGKSPGVSPSPKSAASANASVSSTM